MQKNVVFYTTREDKEITKHGALVNFQLGHFSGVEIDGFGIGTLRKKVKICLEPISSEENPKVAKKCLSEILTKIFLHKTLKGRQGAVKKEGLAFAVGLAPVFARRRK